MTTQALCAVVICKKYQTPLLKSDQISITDDLATCFNREFISFSLLSTPFLSFCKKLVLFLIYHTYTGSIFLLQVFHVCCNICAHFEGVHSESFCSCLNFLSLFFFLSVLPWTARPQTGIWSLSFAKCSLILSFNLVCSIKVCLYPAFFSSLCLDII